MKQSVLLLFILVNVSLIAEKRANFLFIIVDDMGYGDLGATGHPFVKTPALDKLAESSAQFTNFYSPASVCSPARAAMMTGRMPYRLGIYGFIYKGGDYVHLKKTETTFPQLLQRAGYQTALVGKWHVSHNDAQQKLNLPTMKDYGFDYWFSSDNNTIIQNKPKWWKNGKMLGQQKGLAANVVGRETLHWLEKERQSDKPFMLAVHFYEPHWLVTGPSKTVKSYEKYFEKNKQRAHYPACLENVDTQVGKILDKLKDLKLEDNTVVIFTSDHGPDRFASGRAYNRNDGRSKPYRGHKYGLWDGSVHVPGFIRWPGVSKAGSKIKAPAGGIDFLPTICSIAKVKVPADLKLDGADITDLLRGKKSIRRKTALQWHHYNSTLKDKTSPRASLRRGAFLICGWYKDQQTMGTGRWYPEHMDYLKNSKLVHFKLYNIEKDPQQKNDLSKEYPERFSYLKKELIQSHQELQNEAFNPKKEVQNAQ